MRSWLLAALSLSGMIRKRLIAVIVLGAALAVAACGGNPSPPGSSDPGGSDERITGRERLGWNQAAADSRELSTFGYVAYVDNNRVALTGVSCGQAGGTFQCSSNMPPMSAGSHTIELASYVIATGAESARSAPIRVSVAAATAGAESSDTASAKIETAEDGTRLRLDLITNTIDAPSALAFTGDGRALVGGRRGAIYILPSADLVSRSAQSSIDPAVELSDAYLTAPASGGLLDIALDPAFERSRLAYVLYTTQHRDGTPRFAVARFRESGGRLGERAIIVSGVAASPDRPSGSIGFGKDGKLYAAFDDGGTAVRPRSEGGLNGKVVRFNPDGSTPNDQPSRSPVAMGQYRSPRGLDWQPVSEALWVADAISHDIEVLHVGQSRIALPPGTGASSMAFYRGDLLSSFQGDLLVGASNARALLRLRFDRRDPTRIVGSERLFEEFAGAIATVAVGPEGAIYFGSDLGLFRIRTH